MRTLFFAIIVLLSAPVAHAQSVTRQVRFYPAFQQGTLVGCQLGFSVLRFDTEFSAGQPILLNGLLVFYGERAGNTGAMLRLGVAPGSSPNSFTPVGRAYLLDGLRTNVADSGASFLSDDPGFRVFPFGLGEVTANAIGRTFVERRLRISYGMPNTSVDAPFDVELSAHPDVAQQWQECVEAVVPR